jgi:hypothetical protein
MWRVWVRRGRCIGSWWGNRREGDHWGDLGVDGWIILGLPSFTNMSNAAVGNTVYNYDVSHRFYASSRIIVVEISIL